MQSERQGTLMQPRIRDLQALRGGRRAHRRLQGPSRPIRPDDTDAWLFLFSRLSPRTIYLRFHHVIAEVTKAEAETYTNIDYENNFALVAILGEPPISASSPLAGSRAWRTRSEQRWRPRRRQSPGPRHFHSLARAPGDCCARERHPRLRSRGSAENREMMEVFQDFGFIIDAKYAEAPSTSSFD